MSQKRSKRARQAARGDTQSPGPPSAAPTRARKRLFVVIAGAVAALALWLALRPVLRTEPAVSNGVVLVRGTMAGFRPNVIHAKAGQPLTIRLESLDTSFHRDGGGHHQFAIDELGVNLIAPPLGTAETTFVPRTAGVYYFYCSICCGGKANPSMWGRLIVSA